LAGLELLDVNVIKLELVPSAIIVPLIFIYNPELTLTVTPASIVKVTPLGTSILPVNVYGLPDVPQVVSELIAPDTSVCEKDTLAEINNNRNNTFFMIKSDMGSVNYSYF